MPYQEAEAGMCAGFIIFNEKKETVKICETFLDAALVQR
jgi:hypothetical protein